MPKKREVEPLTVIRQQDATMQRAPVSKAQLEFYFA